MADQRYTIHDQLGAGGNGAVFRAYDTQLKRWVAIKRLLTATEASSTDPNMEELRREADLLASLRNANIVTIFDVGTDAEGLFMVMELLEGPDLADTIAHGPMMQDDFKQLAEQTLEALLAAHNLRILHRDIKPENIKVERLPGGRLQAKIIDFGLARTGLAARKQTEDQEGSVMGSIHYMAPEQLSREPTDVRTDLYSLGCVFYEALSGRKAFDGKTVNEVIDKHIDHDLVPLNQMCPHLPQWLTYWVMRLMACKPEDRPSGAQQAIEEFRAWEKLPPAPGMMPWMPMNYGYGYAAPQHYTGAVPLYQNTGTVPLYQNTGQVPLQTGSYYPHITSSSVPIPTVVEQQPEVASAPIPVAQVAYQPAAPAPQRPAGPKAHPAAPAPAPAQDKKKLYIIGGAVLAVALVVFFLFGGKKGKGTGPIAQVPSGVQIGDAREDLYPNERSFPQPDLARVLQVMAAIGRHGYLPNGEPSPQIDGGNTVSILEDLSKVGNNTPLVASGYDQTSSPESAPWNTPDKALKDNRIALQFTSKAGKPVVMRLLNADKNLAKFPFGGEVSPGQPGLTLGVVFQADDKQLPTQVLKLASQDGKSSLTLSVGTDRNIALKIESAGQQTTLTSKYVDATKPAIAVITWDGNSTEMRLRTRDQRGMTNVTAGKMSAPPSPLFMLETGSAGADKALQFSGKLAEIVLLSVAQKDDQASLLDKDLREYYFNTPKPGVLNPSKNKALADFPVGEERAIFNERDLTGWEGSSKYWSVKDGALTAKGDPTLATGTAANLIWKDGTVGDFELTVKMRLQGGSNSGVYYRAFVTGATGDGPPVNGYQMDFDGGQKQRFGGLYEGGVRGGLGNLGQKLKIKDQADPKKFTQESQPTGFATATDLVNKLKLSDWNEVRIRAEGNHLQHFINNQQVLDVIDEGHGRLKEGIIGFEWQTKTGSTIQFKDIRVKRLK